MAETFGEHIKRIRDKFGYSTRKVEQRSAELGDEFRVSGSYLSQVERGVVSPPQAKKIQGLVHAYKLSEEEHVTLLRLAGLYGKPAKTAEPPIGERVQEIRRRLGEGMQSVVEAVEFVMLPSFDQVVHAGRGGGIPGEGIYMQAREVAGRRLAVGHVRGDCMEPELQDGSEVVIDLEASPREGDVVVALLNGDDFQVRTLLGTRRGRVTLGCENPTYPPVEVEDVRIIGVVIQSTKRVRRQRKKA